jgi:hypothetical protein
MTRRWCHGATTVVVVVVVEIRWRAAITTVLERGFVHFHWFCHFDLFSYQNNVCIGGC